MAALEAAILAMQSQNLDNGTLPNSRAPKCYADLPRPVPASTDYLTDTVGVPLDWQVKYTTIYDYMSPENLFALPQAKQTRLEKERADFTARLFFSTFEIKQFGAANSDLYFIRYVPSVSALPVVPYFAPYTYSAAPTSSRVLYAPVEAGALTTFLVAFYNMLWPSCVFASAHKCFLGAVTSSGFDIIKEMDKRYIYITDTCLWDTEECCFVDPTTPTPSPTSPNVFYRVFDSTFTSGDEVLVPAPTADATPETNPLLDRTKRTYDMVLTRLTNPPSNPNDYMHNPVIASWACDRPRVYQDILYMYANVFMAHKQLGAWFLEGVGRNAKSTSVSLLRSLIGTNNSSQVPLADMGDYHFFHSLSRTLLNCPDETRAETMNQDTQSFRIVASHSSMEMSKMYSQVSAQMLCNFVSIFPVNHTPRWSGEEAQACLRRTLVIPYEADFSQVETPTVPFGQTTFTPEFMYDLLGEVLAYATYFRHNRWTPSGEMQSEASAIALVNDPQSVFFKQFTTYFDGFQSYELLNKEFKNWCLNNGVNYDERADKIDSRQMRWRRFVSRTVRLGNKTTKVRCLSNISSPRILLADKKYKFFLDTSNNRYLNGRTVSEFLNAPYPLSVIYDFIEYQKYVRSHAAANSNIDPNTNRPYKPTDPEHPSHLRPNAATVAAAVAAAAIEEERRRLADEQYQRDLAALKAQTAQTPTQTQTSAQSSTQSPTQTPAQTPAQTASEPTETASTAKTTHIPITTPDDAQLEPDTTHPDTTHPDTAQPDTAQPDSAVTLTGELDLCQPPPPSPPPS